MPRVSKLPWRQSKSRNRFLIRGVQRYSRSASFRRAGWWAKKYVKTPKTHAEIKAELLAKRAALKKKEVKTKPFGKKGEKREVKKKTPKAYPEDDLRHPLFSRKNSHKPAHLRKSLVPGTVLILLAGRYRGRRVIFLKQLKSGLLLITGPFKLNGVPLRRVNQAYVIATSTRIGLPFKVDAKYDDKYFAKPKAQKKKKSEADFFAQPKSEEKKEEKKDAAADKTKKAEKKKPVRKSNASDDRKKDQKDVDAKILPLIKKVPYLKWYLRAKFSLQKGQYPHMMKF
jgi:large subunit ribosomal protein L6e